MSLRRFWRRNFSRRWVYSIKIHRNKGGIPIIPGETLGGLSTECIIPDGFITISGFITRRQKELLSSACENCLLPFDENEFKEILLNR
jgi:multimeric flavodoxin WrbA